MGSRKLLFAVDVSMEALSFHLGPPQLWRPIPCPGGSASRSPTAEQAFRRGAVGCWETD